MCGRPWRRTRLRADEVLELDVSTNFEDAITGHPIEVGRTAGVARHESKQARPPSNHCSVWDRCLSSEEIRRVLEIHLDARRNSEGQHLEDVWRLHEAVMRENPHDSVPESLDIDSVCFLDTRNFLHVDGQ